MGRNATVGPFYTRTSPGHDSPAPDLEHPAVTDKEIRALAEALDRYLQWQQRQIQLSEERKFKQRLKREAAA